MKIELWPLHPSFGAEVLGVDLARDLDEATIATIRDAWTRHSLLLFRDVRMTPAQHVAFTRRLGSLHVMEPLEVIAGPRAISQEQPGVPPELGWQRSVFPDNFLFTESVNILAMVILGGMGICPGLSWERRCSWPSPRSSGTSKSTGCSSSGSCSWSS